MVNKTIGQSGENKAAEFLVGLGFRVLERNYRCRWGEADLVAWNGKEVYLVEVKARTGSGFGAPAEAIGRKKLQRMKRVAENYGIEREVRVPIQLGVVTILGENTPELITEIEVVD